MSDISLSRLPDTSGGRADRSRRRRRGQRVRTAVVLILCLALVGVAAWFAYGFVRPVVDGMRESDDYPGPGSGSVQVQVEAGDSGRAIGRTLADAGVVKSADAFVTATDADPRAASIQPGTYELASKMPASAALEALLDPASRVSLRVTVPEGTRAQAVYGALSQASGVPVEQFQDAAAQPEALGLPASAQGDPEGYLFPATYEFEPDATATEMLMQMVKRSKEALATVGVPQAREREVVTKASLVEEEAHNPEDFGKVARVIENRLEAGMPLQLDSTVNYATGNEGITTTDADRATDSPYNTYRYPGLPPGPVSSPGEQALQAVMDPTPGDWLYFVAVNPDTGETRFAVTAAEHQRNVELFRQWLRENG